MPPASSAATMVSHAVPRPTRMPAMMSGSTVGTTTWRRIQSLLAPCTTPTLRWIGSTRATPTRVEVKTGKKAPRKIRNAKRVSPEKKMMASGIHAIGGMKRNGSMHRARAGVDLGIEAHQQPERHAQQHAEAEADEHALDAGPGVRPVASGRTCRRAWRAARRPRRSSAGPGRTVRLPAATAICQTPSATASETMFHSARRARPLHRRRARGLVRSAFVIMAMLAFLPVGLHLSGGPAAINDERLPVTKLDASDARNSAARSAPAPRRSGRAGSSR